MLAALLLLVSIYVVLSWDAEEKDILLVKAHTSTCSSAVSIRTCRHEG